jgi:hypothetical protein
MKRLLIAQMLVLSLFTSASFAEGGADTLFERTKTRTKEAISADQRRQNDNQDAARSDTRKNTKSSS